MKSPAWIEQHGGEIAYECVAEIKYLLDCIMGMDKSSTQKKKFNLFPISFH